MNLKLREGMSESMNEGVRSCDNDTNNHLFYYFQSLEKLLFIFNREIQTQHLLVYLSIYLFI